MDQDREKILTTLTALANGVDPFTGEILADSSIYNNPEIIRDLFNAIELIKKSKNPKTRQKASNSGSAWTQEKDFELINLFKDNKDTKWIAERIGRSVGAVQSRLLKLSLIEIKYSESK